MTGTRPSSFRNTLDGVIGLAAHRYPLYRGQSKISDLLPTRPRDADADPTVEVRLRSGFKILVRDDEHIGHIVSLFGDLEPKLSWVCGRLLRPGDTVVDVGANYGVITLLAARAVGATGLVHSFEPQPGLADLLRRSIALNRLDNVHVHEQALSEADGALELHIPSENLGAGSLTRSLHGPGTVITVPVRTSGDRLAELDLPHVRLLKVDIEGHEPEFLRGARSFLASAVPDVIVFESNDHIVNSGDTPMSLWERPVVKEILDLGYQLAGIDRTIKSIFRVGLTRLQPGRDDDFGHSLDYVAVSGPQYRPVAALLGIKDGSPSTAP